MFKVYEGKKPAEMVGSDHFWSTGEFITKREAEVYAYLWAYPIVKSEAEIRAPEMEIGKAYDYGQTKVPVMMRIEEM